MADPNLIINDLVSMPNPREKRLLHFKVKRIDAFLSKKRYWISSRDTVIITGASSSESFSLCIHHRVIQTFRFTQRSPSRSIIEFPILTSGIQDQTVVLLPSLSHSQFQSLHHQAFVTCAESRIMTSVTVLSRDSLYFCRSLFWMQAVKTLLPP